MNTGGKILLGSGVVAVLAAATFYSGLLKAADNLDVVLLKSEADKGLRLKDVLKNPLNFQVKYNFEIRLKNPTNASVQFTKPYVRVRYNDSVIATSTLPPTPPPGKEKDYELLPSKGQYDAKISLVMVASDLLANMPDFTKHIIAKLSGGKQTRKVELEVLTDVKGAGTVPVKIPFTI